MGLKIDSNLREGDIEYLPGALPTFEHYVTNDENEKGRWRKNVSDPNRPYKPSGHVLPTANNAEFDKRQLNSSTNVDQRKTPPVLNITTNDQNLTDMAFPQNDQTHTLNQLPKSNQEVKLTPSNIPKQQDNLPNKNDQKDEDLSGKQQQQQFDTKHNNLNQSVLEDISQKPTQENDIKQLADKSLQLDKEKQLSQQILPQNHVHVKESNLQSNSQKPLHQSQNSQQIQQQQQYPQQGQQQMQKSQQSHQQIQQQQLQNSQFNQQQQQTNQQPQQQTRMPQKSQQPTVQQQQQVQNQQQNQQQIQNPQKQQQQQQRPQQFNPQQLQQQKQLQMQKQQYPNQQMGQKPQQIQQPSQAQNIQQEIGNGLATAKKSVISIASKASEMFGAFRGAFSRKSNMAIRSDNSDNIPNRPRRQLIKRHYIEMLYNSSKRDKL
ncbi:DgyrCDS6762 [Dimorphilus gyrociliatus]|uniref:DgyrCDS6762 n=1 Tax=Dimorphilus gyrociliatus TaxID=2664684 RepID=A0A7I8VP45_9ANNE|nr:DgyrCDS6762 [Dimorphilus gyrociliatus]